MQYETNQENFWAGEFGNNYTERNSGNNFITLAKNQLENSLRKAEDINSAIELGSNTGNNMEALSSMFPQMELHAIEINKTAYNILENKKICTTYNSSLLDFNTNRKFDLAFTSGVLIHIAPDSLPKAYKKLYELSNKYILMIEYYNHVPEEINYRGNLGKLYRRDFASEIIEQHPSLNLIDYGFLYHNDNDIQRREDMYWFLLEK